MLSDSEERTNVAFRYLKQGEADPVTQRAFDAGALNHAIRISDAVILELKGMADAKQAALIRNGTPPPPTGEVSSEQRKAIMAYGPLNDVATCLWIKGRSWDYLSKTNEAWQAYSQLTNYPHARTWDPRGWFWSPTEDALGRLSNRAAP